MLLVIDVGNTNIVYGLFEGTTLVHQFRVESGRGRTADEYAVVLRQLLLMHDIAPGDVQAAILASVVPSLTEPMVDLVRRAFGREALVVGPGVRTGMSILYENPREVGADRIVNAVAAHDRWPGGAIVVDFGTATTFDVVTARGEYAGGVIAPGLTVAADALYHATAKLPRVEIVRPATALGRNTVASMQSGLVFGYAGLVDAIVERIRAEVDFSPRVVGTGGLAPLIARETRTIAECDDMLTLRGLAIIYERNR
jgi:type III pantothenate kinase